MEYHKIETLYERDIATFKVHTGILKNRVYGLLKSWHWTEKVDGTNIRCIWQPAVNENGDGRGCPESLMFGGKTDMHSCTLIWLSGSRKT